MRRRTSISIAGWALAAIAACGGLSHDRDSDGGNAALEHAGSGGTGPGSSGRGTAPGKAGAGSSLPNASTGGSSSTTTPHVQTARVPQKHRPAAIACDHQRPAGNARPYGDVVPCPDGGTCAVPDGCTNCRAECVEYADGLGPVCVSGYGECLSDADCTAKDNGRCWDNRGNWFCTYDSCYADSTCTSGGPCACEGESGSPGNTCLPGNCQTDADCPANGFCSPTLGGCGNYGGVIAYYCHSPADTCLDDADCVRPQGPGYCMYNPEVGHWSCGYGQCVG